MGNPKEPPLERGCVREGAFFFFASLSEEPLPKGVWHKASVSDCLPLAAPIGLSPLLILTLCGSERALVVSTEPLDDVFCLTTLGVGCPGDRLLLCR